MFQKLKKYFSSEKEERIYKPVKHIFFRNPEITQALHNQGYYIVDFLNEKERQQLLDVYKKYHTAKDDGGGAFWGVISKNIHDAEQEILGSHLDQWFHDYKNVNAFVVKTPGKSSQVPVHQDVAAIDEFKYSNVTVWMPLQAINTVNGALYIIPRSHHIFVPYRCATIDPLTKDIESILYPYFIPLYLEPGQALFFDSRMFHYSPPNLSDQSRVVAVSRIFPKEADYVTYYKEKTEDSKIEMWRCPDDYLMHNNTYDETLRPPGGKFIKHRYVNTHPLTAEEFEERRAELEIVPQSKPASQDEGQRSFMHEPVRKKIITDQIL